MSLPKLSSSLVTPTVKNIEDRDNYNYTDDAVVEVLDASADPEVTSGKAYYLYYKESNQFIRST